MQFVESASWRWIFVLLVPFALGSLPDPALAIVLAALAVVGAGIGVAFAPMTAAALNAVPAAKAGMAAGALLMARMVGATVGVATSGAVFTALENRKLDALEQPLSRREITDVTSLLSGSASPADTLSRLPPASARVLVADAAEAFSHGLTGAMALTASVAAIGAALVFALGRRDAR